MDKADGQKNNSDPSISEIPSDMNESAATSTVKHHELKPNYMVKE
jgi:hypothetical protein